VVSLVVEVTIPHLIMDLQNSQKRLFESSMNGPTPDVPIQDIFALYRRAKLLLGMYSAFVPGYAHLNKFLFPRSLLSSLAATYNSILLRSSNRMYVSGL